MGYKKIIGFTFMLTGIVLIILGVKYRAPKGVGMEVVNVRYIGSGVLFIMGGLFALCET